VFVPKLVTTLKQYDRRQFAADLTAGTIVGIVALPLAIAFAILWRKGPRYFGFYAGWMSIVYAPKYQRQCLQTERPQKRADRRFAHGLGFAG
jgi:hypothetical protein